MFPPNAQHHSHVAGNWSVWIDGINRTFVRGIPVQIGNIEDTDPFGPASASFSLPMVSALETIGDPGTELEWLKPNAKVEINFTVDPYFARALYTMYREDNKMVWEDPDDWPQEVKGTESWYQNYSWKGFIVAFSFESNESTSSVNVECVGALRALDNILQLERKTSQPVAFETAIRSAINHASSSLGHDSEGHPLVGSMSSEWIVFNDRGGQEDLDLPQYKQADVVVYDGGVPAENVPPNPVGVEWWRIPKNIQEGQYWSGMLTRDRGNNDKTMTGYVQGMLEMMYTRKGRFTVDLKPGTWDPELKHLDLFAFHKREKILQVESVWPGVKINLDQDFSQSATTVYGKVAQSLDGSSYTGEEFDAYGTESWVEPFADNSFLSDSMKREVFIQFPDGLGVDEAIGQAREHVSRNCEPGFTGQITLQGVDPRIWEFYEQGQYGGELLVFPRQLIKPGMYVSLNGFQGRSSGLILYVANVSHAIETNTTTLTVDTKARDFLTVDQVRNRGRDSMSTVHLLTVGSYQGSTAADRLLPWDPKQSGFIPDASKQLWANMVSFTNGSKPVGSPWYGKSSRDMSNFPWYDLCKAFPPKDNTNFYAKIPGVDDSNPWGAPNSHKDAFEVGRFWYPNTFGERNDAQFRAFNINSEYWDHTNLDDEGNPIADGGTRPRPWPQEGDEDEGVYTWPPQDLAGPGTDEQKKERWDQNYPGVWEIKPIRVLKRPSSTYIPLWYNAYHEALAQRQAFPDHRVRLAYSGQAKSLKVMCVDADGEPLNVTFYVSLYQNLMTSPDSEAQVPVEGYPDFFVNRSTLFPTFKVHQNTRYYGEGANYPFYPYAGESKLPDGTTSGPDGNFTGRAVNTAAISLRLGSYWERPGFWPYSMQDEEVTSGRFGPTGLLVHDSAFDISAQSELGGDVPVLPSSITDNSIGYGSFNIFCDDLPNVDKYFIGRIYVEQRGNSR